MIILGLTGSIGMGKSTVAAMFADAGVPVFDADAEVHRLQGPGGEVVEPIEEAFPGTTSADGVDRTKLSAAVLGKPDELAKLEAIVHPAVGKARVTFMEDNADAPIILFDIPLLFEKTGKAGLDAVIVVSAPAEMQRERVLARSNMSEEKFNHILSLQMPDAQKREQADFIIDTGLKLEETRAQVDAIVTCLSAHDVQYCKNNA